jgi:hypothetical protein
MEADAFVASLGDLGVSGIEALASYARTRIA